MQLDNRPVQLETSEELAGRSHARAVKDECHVDTALGPGAHRQYRTGHAPMRRRPVGGRSRTIDIQF